MKIITRQHSGGAMLAVAYVTRQYKWHSIGGRHKVPTSVVPLQNQQSLF
jgi:hypothetical protein